LIKACVIGATGYTGAVLTDILSGHPQVESVTVTSRSYVGETVSAVFPGLRIAGEYIDYSLKAVAGSDVAFVCYPHAEAHVAVAELVDAGCRVVDLSADHRLKDPESYESWYGFVHPRPDLVGEAVFGLPERYEAEVKRAQLVANPGCYPTAMLLSLLPIAQDIDAGGVIVDAKSGVSGAGRTPSAKTHFCAVNGDFKAYSEVGHRHIAEMMQELALAAGRPVPVSFTPHLLPVDRGIMATSYFRPVGGLVGTDRWLQRYRDFYAGHLFIEVTDHVPGLAEVVNTNFCRLTVREDESAGLVKVFAVIDNLVKGASGQAVQNLNLMFGFSEDAGLRRKV
jgi:N-acetyl-gamma-glutamyl-phosphate reductase